MFFHAQFQTQTYFETAQAVWVPKQYELSPQKYFFSICIQLKLSKDSKLVF